MKTTKKLLSVLLAVVMLMTSMSVCFGTVSFAASGTVSGDQWNSLYEALKADSVKNAEFSTKNGVYTVDDPDGNVLKAVEAYFTVFNTLANKTPTTGNPDNTNTSYTTGSSEGNRVIQQVNASIKDYVSKNMSGYEASMGTFITNILGTASVSTGTGAELTVGNLTSNTTNNKTLPTNNLADVAPISITVVSGSAVTGFDLSNLPSSVVTEKNFTVTHAKDRYDYKYATGSTGGCNSKTTYARYYKFFYYISGVSSSNGAEISTQVIKDSAAVLEANSAYFSYTLDQFVELGFNDTSAITAIKKAVVDAKDAVVNAFSGSVYNHFFSAYNVEALSALIDKAVEIITAAGIAIDLDALVDAGYTEIITDKGALEALANNIKTLADKYDAYVADVKAYVESHEYEGEYFDRAAVTAFYNAVIREIELIELRALKATIETEVVHFLGYNEENVADRIVSGAELNYAKGTVDGWSDALDTYADANVAEVWGDEDIDAFLAGLSDNLEYLITVNGYTDSFANEYAYYVSTVYGNTNIDADSADLLAAVKAYDSWYTGLKNLVNNIEYNLDADLADRILKTMDDEMKAHLDSKYNALHTRVLAQIDVAYELYNLLLKDDLNISIVNLNTFAKFEKAFDVIEKDVYDFLIASAIIPLLEALGATPAALAEGENALTAVLNALLARVDAIVADPVDEILGVIPSLLYFVKSNGLTTAVRNLLQPVLVILETIDPVYALNLNELIGGLTKDLGFTIDLGNLGFEAIFDILGAVVDLDLSELEEIIDDVCEVITAKDYASASSIIGANGKKGAYGEYFDAADLLTVLVSFALAWVQEGNNANDIVALIAGDDAEKAAEIQKYITGAITIIGGIDPEYLPIDWAYNFPADYADSIFESGLTIQPTINTINYPTNWTEDTAKYVAENLDEIVDEIIGLIDENYATLADFIADKLTIYSNVLLLYFVMV